MYTKVGDNGTQQGLGTQDTEPRKDSSITRMTFAIRIHG